MVKYNTFLRIPQAFLLLIVLAFTGCNEPNTSADTTNDTVLSEDSNLVEIKRLSEEIKANPSDVSLYIKRSELYQQIGQYKGSYLDGLQAIAVDSLNPKAWLAFGKAAFTVENYLRCEEGYKRCIQLDKSNTDCMVKLAEFYLLRRNYKGAMAFANKALEVDDQLARPYFIKGWTYAENGDTAKASTSYQTAIELDPNFYDAYIQLGVLAQNASRPVALEYFNSALAVRPTSTEALYFIGMYQQNHNMIPDAISTYERIMVVDSTYPNAPYNIGYIKLTIENKPDSAIAFFSKAINANPNYAEAFYNRGYCKELLGQKSQASNDYKLCLSIDNEFDPAREGLKRVQ